MSRIVATLFCTALLAACAAPGPSRDAGVAGMADTPVAAVDLQRYAGLWYEQAHLPLWFQRQCVSDTTAQYTLQPDGRIGVVNRCRARDGSFDEVRGEARRVDGSSSQLEVRFAPAWLSWLPLVWGDYRVIALDDGYGWAMVGSPDRRYLWILSRTPQLDPGTMQRLVERARAMGYPMDKLIDTPHGPASGGA